MHDARIYCCDLLFIPFIVYSWKVPELSDERPSTVIKQEFFCSQPRVCDNIKKAGAN